MFNVAMQGQAIGLDQFKDFVFGHADHHATSKAAMPTPMAKAVNKSMRVSFEGFIGFFRLSDMHKRMMTEINFL